MPQLDFFSYSQQFYAAVICFCGLYYFNLLILFPFGWWLSLCKIYVVRFHLLGLVWSERFWLVSIVPLSFQINLFFSWKDSILKNGLNFFFVPFISFKNKLKLDTNFNLFFIFYFLFFIFFIKNIISFNAEKLMFIYFLSLSFILLNLILKNIKFLINSEIVEFLNFIAKAELRVEKTIYIFKKITLELINIITFRFIESMFLHSFWLKNCFWLNE